jgi:hypothetical protein
MQAMLDSAGRTIFTVLEVPEKELRCRVDRVLASGLSHLMSHQASAADKARLFVEQTISSLTERLDQQLRSHRPRAGLVDEDARQERSSQLESQRRQMNRFVQSQTEAINRQVCRMRRLKCDK